MGIKSSDLLRLWSEWKLQLLSKIMISDPNYSCNSHQSSATRFSGKPCLNYNLIHREMPSHRSKDFPSPKIKISRQISSPFFQKAVLVVIPINRTRRRRREILFIFFLLSRRKILFIIFIAQARVECREKREATGWSEFIASSSPQEKGGWDANRLRSGRILVITW